MKTRMIVIVCGLILVVGLLILNFTGILPWQKIAIIFAAVVAPLRHLGAWLKGSGEKITEIETAHAQLRGKETDFRKSGEDELAKNNAKMKEVNVQIADVKKEQEVLEAQRIKAHEILQNVSDEELLKALKKTLGQQ